MRPRVNDTVVVQVDITSPEMGTARYHTNGHLAKVLGYGTEGMLYIQVDLGMNTAICVWVAEQDVETIV